jgi:hypothetical protein
MNRASKFIIVLVVFIMPTLAYGWTVSCSDSRITVQADIKNDAESVCNTTSSVRKTFSSMGLKLPERLTIRLSHELPHNEICHFKCIGLFEANTNSIFLLDYESTHQSSKHSPLFINEEMAPALWLSYIIHELAHAAIQNTVTPGTPLCIASEYIASVAQLEALPATERNKILNDYSDIHGFVKNEEITLLYDLIDPGKFIVNSYLHYHRPENGPSFIKKILRDGLSCDEQ